MARSLMPAVRVYPTHEAASRAGAEDLVHSLNESLQSKNCCTVAVSGGTTPRLLYKILAEEYAGRIPWEKVHVYWVDERYVPKMDSQSNFRMLNESLLQHVRIPPGNVHSMPTHYDDPDDAARDYETIMRSQFPGRWPRFDAILLGMGKDGHVASIFPGSTAVEENVRWVVAASAPVEPSVRLTLTFPVINNAAHVYFLVSGREKADALKYVLTIPADAGKYPAALVRPRHGQLVWRVDEASFSKTKDAEVSGFSVER